MSNPARGTPSGVPTLTFSNGEAHPRHADIFKWYETSFAKHTPPRHLKTLSYLSDTAVSLTSGVASHTRGISPFPPPRPLVRALPGWFCQSYSFVRLD